MDMVEFLLIQNMMGNGSDSKPSRRQIRRAKINEINGAADAEKYRVKMALKNGTCKEEMTVAKVIGVASMGVITAVVLVLAAAAGSSSK